MPTRYSYENSPIFQDLTKLAGGPESRLEAWITLAARGQAQRNPMSGRAPSRVPAIVPGANTRPYGLFSSDIDVVWNKRRFIE